MKTIIFLLLSTVAFWTISCKNGNSTVGPDPLDGAINEKHPMRDSLQAIINRHVAKGIPGVQVVVKNKDGWYFASGGYASLETKAPITKDMTSWYFSLTKTYTAALVMKLSERGTIKLDAPITQYLLADITSKIPDSEKITVRMLLNHSSGIVNLTALPAFLEWQFSKPLQQPSVAERLAMVAGQPLNFEPGTDFLYSNTNYLLLTLIIEKASGKSYGEFLKQEIITPLGLKETYYDLSETQRKTLSFPDTYADVDNSSNLINATLWNSALGNSCVGYGGIAGSAADAIRFYEALVTGKVVSPASLQAMKTWIRGKASTQPDYGLGLEYFLFGPGTPQFGHEGDGLANTTQVMYVPDNDTYLFINCLAGRQLPSPYLYKTTDMKIELAKYVAKWRKNNAG